MQILQRKSQLFISDAVATTWRGSRRPDEIRLRVIVTSDSKACGGPITSDGDSYLKDVQVLEHAYRGVNATRRGIGLFFPY